MCSDTIKVIDTQYGPIITLREDDEKLRPVINVTVPAAGELSNPSDTYGHDSDEEVDKTTGGGRHDSAEYDDKYDREVFDSGNIYMYGVNDDIVTIRGTLTRDELQQIEKNLINLVGAAGDIVCEWCV